MHISIHVTEEPVRVEPRDRLQTRPDACVAIGEGPDGLPLVLQVWRYRNVREPILSVLGRSGSRTTDLPFEVSSAIETLQSVVTKQSVKTRIGKHEGTLGYTSMRPIGAMLGASLFAKALGEVGPLGEDDASFARRGDDLAAVTSAGVVMSAAQIKQMLGSAGSSRRLFVPIAEGRCRVLLEDDRSETSAEEPTSRPILFERLAGLARVRFGYCYKDGHWHSEAFDETNAGPYREAVRTAESLAWWIPRQSFGLALADLAERLSVEVHHRGRVHGDIKPANMLVPREGAVAIDSLDLEEGKIATVCTPSWAAPEQVTVRPVTAATDVYALGLVLARLLGAVVFGEERTFIVPTGGSAKRRMQVLTGAQVFLDPTSPLSTITDDKAMRAYASFITRCASFDPSSRPQSGAKFANELRDLLDRHPLSQDREAGWVRLGWLAGALHRSVDLLGAAQPAWVISDGGSF